MCKHEPDQRRGLLSFVSQEHLDESQIDAGFKSLFRQLAGPVSTFCFFCFFGRNQRKESRWRPA